MYGAISLAERRDSQPGFTVTTRPLTRLPLVRPGIKMPDQVQRLCFPVLAAGEFRE